MHFVGAIARAPLRPPLHVAFLVCWAEFPNRKIGNISLALHADSGTGFKPGDIKSGEMAIILELAGIEIEPIAVNNVRVAFGLKNLGKCNLLLDIIGCPDEIIRAKQTKLLCFAVRDGNVLIGDVPRRKALMLRAFFHLVLARVIVACQMANIGDILGALNRKTFCA